MLARVCRALVGVCVKNMFEDLFSIVSCANTNTEIHPL